MDTTKSTASVMAICIVLVVLVWAVFGQTLGHEFFNYDDAAHVYENPVVQGGFSQEGIRQAFSPEMRGLQYPLTTLSFMLDREWYGMEARGFHLTNVLLHMATAVCLFLVLRSMTGAYWQSAIVAAVFAIHPLRAESVAWITERKDVLSGLFFMLTLHAYQHYVRRSFSVFRYLPVGLFFVLGLLSKPMLVTLPFLLLLLDIWPLRRLETRPTAREVMRVLLEKVPLFLLAAVAVAATAASHGTVEPISKPMPVSWRFGNALVSSVIYIRQMVWPTGLAVYYPHRGPGLPGWQIGGALLVLAGISYLVFRRRKAGPYMLVGWLWYLGMLVPVIGILRTLGGAAHADRFTYLPQIGLAVMMVWLAADLSAGWRHRRWILGTAVTVMLLILSAAARIQTSYWCNSRTLWSHTLAHTRDNFIAHSNLGNVLSRKGELDAAAEHYRHAIRILPNYPGVQKNLGRVLARQGQVSEAISAFRRSLQLNPDDALVYRELGDLLYGQCKYREAMKHYEESIRLQPADVRANNNLAWLLSTCPDPVLRDGKRAVAITLSMQQQAGGDHALILDTLAAAYAEAGDFQQAEASARRALKAAAGQEALVAGIRKRLECYRSGHPYHEPEG